MRQFRSVHRRTRILAIGAIALLAVTGCAQSDTTTAPSTGSPEAVVESMGERLPAGFSYVDAVAPGILIEARYGTNRNFTGSVVDGYAGPDVAILRDEAAQALAKVQALLAERGQGLLVWDAFRPTRAVADFVAWSKTPDDATRAEYYPDLDKRDLFELGYIALESRHSLGGTVDLTIVDAQTGEQLDMGGPFDYFGELSHFDAAGLSAEQRANRALLREAMEAQGFEPYPLEWWHFSYPLPEGTPPADFPVS